MKCPMRKMGLQLGEAAITNEFGNCFREECAWWHETTDQLGIIHAACAVQHIADRANEVTDDNR